jgi:hypothetical protein
MNANLTVVTSAVASVLATLALWSLALAASWPLTHAFCP